MARRTRPKSAARAVPRTVLVPPDEHSWVESDAYDRSAFATLVATVPALGALADEGAALVPHFDALLADVFCLLFKLEPRLRAPAEVAPAAALNRALLAAFRDHPLLEHLHEQTQLDETRAGLATVLIGERLLALVREERLLPRGDLLDLWDLEHGETDLRARADELKELERLAREGDEDAAAAAQRARAEAERAAVVAEARLRQKARLV
ncbi:MAG TPA: hypothetical protein VKA21_13300, partial [Candidatus Binatia bacterium]|nr:hypothetical protein [Candidatus Binatia bacterium]